MKSGHMGINIAVPNAKVHALAKLDGGNRTTSVNKAIQLYLDVQGPTVNSHGVDVGHARNVLVRMVSNLDSYTSEALRRELLRLEAVLAGNRGDAEREMGHGQV